MFSFIPSCISCEKLVLIIFPDLKMMDVDAEAEMEDLIKSLQVKMVSNIVILIQ